MKAIEHYKIDVRIGNGAGAADVIQRMSVPRYELMILKAIHNRTDDEGQEMEMVIHKGREIVPLAVDEDGNQKFSPLATLDQMRRKYGNRRNNKIVSKLFKTSKALGRTVKILEVPNETRAPIQVPRGMKASAVAAKLMAATKPAPRKAVKKHRVEHRAAA
jgi:hypothetical protein